MERWKKLRLTKKMNLGIFFHYSAAVECLGNLCCSTLSRPSFSSSINLNSRKNSLSSVIALIS